MRSLIILLLLMQFSLVGWNQEFSSDSTGVSKIQIIQDARLVILEENPSELSTKAPTKKRQPSTPSPKKVRGYRIQIYSGNDREYADDIRQKFKYSYPQIPCYIEFISPYYKVRVGDFATAAEAEKKANYLKRVYTSAYVVTSYINQ